MSLLKQDNELSSVFKALVIEGKQITAEQFWRARIVNPLPYMCPGWIYADDSICWEHMRLNGLSREAHTMSSQSWNQKRKTEPLKWCYLPSASGISLNSILSSKRPTTRTCPRSLVLLSQYISERVVVRRWILVEVLLESVEEKVIWWTDYGTRSSRRYHG